MTYRIVSFSVDGDKDVTAAATSTTGEGPEIEIFIPRADVETLYFAEPVTADGGLRQIPTPRW